MDSLRPALKIAALIGVFMLLQNRQSVGALLIGDIAYDGAAAGPVELYSTSWCGFCRDTREFLADRDIPYVEYDVEASQAARQRFQALGGVGVPLLVVGDRTVSGYRPFAFRDALESASAGAD